MLKSATGTRNYQKPIFSFHIYLSVLGSGILRNHFLPYIFKVHFFKNHFIIYLHFLEVGQNSPLVAHEETEAQ